MQPSFFSHLAVLWAPGKMAPLCIMSCVMPYVTVRTDQLSIYCIAAAWQLLDFALLALYVLRVKAQRVQPIVSSLWDQLSILTPVMSPLVIYMFCCVLRMSTFVCFIMRSLGQSRRSLIYCTVNMAIQHKLYFLQSLNCLCIKVTLHCALQSHFI